MAAAEPGQRGVVERLHAEGEPVDAGRAEGGQPATLHAGRVGFQGDFYVVRRLEQAGRVLDQGGDRLGRHQAGGATAEENRGERASAEPRRLPSQLAPQCRGEARLRDAVANMAVKVAIRAFLQAERPVDVERQRLHRCRLPESGG